MTHERSSYLTPPPTVRKSLSFAAARPRALAQWVSQLPKVNHAETSRQLCLAVREINELKIGPADRIELLDLLAPSIEEAADALCRQYLTHPLALSDRERKVISLAQTMAADLAAGYKAVAMAAGNARWGRSRKELPARALHHCLWALLPTLRRRFSLYLPPPTGFWAELHALFQRSEQLGTGDEKYAWAERHCSLNQAYKGALLFSIAQPFQLQRYELDLAYQAALAWSDLATLRPSDEQSIYLIDLQQDTGPVYRNEQMKGETQCLGFSTSQLLTLLQQDNALPKVRGMTERLQRHLAVAWDRAQQRRHRRQPDFQAIELTLGLSAVHSQLCDGQTFQSFIRPYTDDEDEATPHDRFQARDTLETQKSRDVWEHSFDAGGSHFPPIPNPKESENETARLDERISVPVFVMNAADISPRGFRLHWSDHIPESLAMGEVVSVRSAHTRRWTIGLLRWLRQASGADLYLGIELLSPKAEACAVRILNKTGQHSGFLRAFVLPEISALAQPESLLLPHLNVREGQKVLLCRRGRRAVYRLDQKITETSAVGQFALSSTAQIGVTEPTAKAKAAADERFAWPQSKHKPAP